MQNNSNMLLHMLKRSGNNPVIGQPVVAAGVNNPAQAQQSIVKPGTNTQSSQSSIAGIKAPTAVAGVSTTTPSSAGLKTYTYKLGNETISKQFADDKAERQFRRDNPFDNYSKAKEMKFLSDIDNMRKNNGGVSVPQMDEYTRLMSKWNYTSSVPQAPSRTNSNQTVPDFLAMTPEMIQKAMEGFTGGGQYYNPDSDPVYKSMYDLANKQADKAGLQTMEAMNDRGILNSTITSDRVGQIKQGASDAVLSSIPGLAANFDNKMANNAAGLQNLLNTVLGAGQFQQGFAEDNQRWDKNFALDEAAVTGRYVSPEAQGLIQGILNSKQYGSTNQNSLNQLASMGYDVSGLGANVNSNLALSSATNMGRNTLAQQEMDLKRSEVMGKESSTTAQGLIQRILQAKQMNEAGQGDRKANTQVQNEARAMLSAMGYDVSGISGNMSYAKASANASKMGAPTLGARELDMKNNQFNAELALENKKLTQDGNQFNREMTYKEEVAKIEADLKSRGLSIDEVRNSISLFQAESDADYKIHQKNLGITDQQAEVATNQAISQALQAPTAADAIDYLTNPKNGLANKGVNINKALQALEYKFPGIKKAVEGGTEQTPTYRDGTTP